ncbi:MAG: manganese efflux pump MntP family protein [Bacteroidales bacterium]|nr:manganese efflux pump MntP family protein [Bacteroidales bacterium]
MNFLEIFILSVGLCFDTLAVSVVSGPFITNRKTINYSYFAFVLALVQAAFILGGLFSGSIVVQFVASFDHWLAFVLLMFLGLRMILSKEENNEEDSQKKFNVLKLPVLLAMGVATSIDALFVGFSLGLVDNNVVEITLSVFFVTALAAIIGLTLGRLFKNQLGKKLNIIGGIILILIGVKILVTHLME